MRHLNTIIVILIVILIIVAGAFAYWYFFVFGHNAQPPVIGNQNPPTGFVPINRPAPATSNQNNSLINNNVATSSVNKNIPPLPVLRLLSATPVGGYGVRTTASTTIVRWVDRGRGNIYEANADSLDIITISNTLLPRVYESWWNNDSSSFIGQYLSDNGDSIRTVVANILKRIMPITNPNATSSVSETKNQSSVQNQDIAKTPYELKGRFVSGNIIAVTASPKKDRILVVTNEDGRSVGYISNFDGSKQTQLFNLPFVQLTAEWPGENIIAVTTKASSYYSGYLYLVNVKTGVISQILGNIPGLSTQVSRDGTKVIYSSTDETTDKIATSIYDIKNQKTTSVIFHTLADKCAWSQKFKEQVYCAVSSKIPNGVYPDDWYIGNVSFIDSIWSLNGNTGEVHRVADLLSQGNAIIDAFNLQLDNNDDFLYFMNKNDLALWSLDLVSSN